MGGCTSRSSQRPCNYDHESELHFEVALAPKEAIQGAINKYYGQVEGESADSMLQEFTDTAIDFTETEDSSMGEDDSVDENSAPVVKLVHMMITEAVQLLSPMPVSGVLKRNIVEKHRA